MDQAKIDVLRARRAALDTRIEKLIARENTARRKKRTRALVLIGSAIEAEIKADPASADAMRQVINDRLIAQRDRDAALAYLNEIT